MRETVDWQKMRPLMINDPRGHDYYETIQSIAEGRINQLCPKDIIKHAEQVIHRLYHQSGYATGIITGLPIRRKPEITADDMMRFVSRALSTPRTDYVPDEIDRKLDEAERYDDGKSYDDAIEFFAAIGIEMHITDPNGVYWKRDEKGFLFTSPSMPNLSPLHIAGCVDKMLDEIRSDSR